MPNTFLTPSIIARRALAVLSEQVVAARLVARDFDADFRGAVGDTITIRKPATFTANVFDRAAGITVQNATEDNTTVTLDTLLDVSFAVTAEDMLMNIEDFATQLLNPAVQAIVDGIESRVADGLVAAAGAPVGSDWTDPTILVDAGKYLNDNKVPARPRHTILSTAQAAEFAKNPLFHQADMRGDTEGLREATIGRKFGFDNYVSTWMGTSVAFHPDALALVSRTLPAPMGVASNQVSVVNAEGFGIRVVRDYDISKKQDVISLDVLIGIAELRGSEVAVALAD